MTEQTTKINCAALQLTDGWECQKCALAWDDGDKRPDCLTLTYGRLIEALNGEAERIEQSQQALTMGGLNDPPINRFRNQAMLRRAMELRASAKLIEKVREKEKKHGHEG